MDDPPELIRESSIPPSLEGKNSLTKLRLEGNNMTEKNLFATNKLSESDPTVIKDSIKQEIQNYEKNQEIYETYKSSLVDNILMLVRLLAGNDSTRTTELLDFKNKLLNENLVVFEKNAEFKRFVTELFDFYSNPDNLGTGENIREGIFNSLDYKIEGGSKARKTKLKKRRLCKRKTRKHRK